MSKPTTRCKFRCSSIETFGPGAGVKVRLAAVYPQAGLDDFEHNEDHAFFNATPSGTLEMQVQNPYGAELFEPGESYYLDISKAPRPEPVKA